MFFSFISTGVISTYEWGIDIIIMSSEMIILSLVHPMNYTWNATYFRFYMSIQDQQTIVIGTYSVTKTVTIETVDTAAVLYKI